MTSLSLKYFNNLDFEGLDICCISEYYYFSNYSQKYYKLQDLMDEYNLVTELDIVVISLTAASMFPTLILFFSSCSEDCKAHECLNTDLCWICSSIKECFEDFCRLCGLCSDSCEECCKICNENDSGDLKTKNNQLILENNNLRNNIEELKNKINEITNQKKLGERNFNNDKKKLGETIIFIHNQTNENLIKEKNLNEEITNLKLKNINLREEIEKLKNKNNFMIDDLNIMEEKLIKENIEIKQLNAIHFYINNKLTPGSQDNNIKNIFKKEIREINDNYGVIIDSDKFQERSLYYIKYKLIENLTDSQTQRIFSNPIINSEGNTYENNNNINNTNNIVKNLLVSEICKILEESEDKLNFENFQKIKKLLVSKDTGKYYKHPVVIIEGLDKGITVENIYYEKLGYENKVIINIIKDIRELLEDDFFKIEAIETDEINIDNIQGFNTIGFDEI